MESLTGLGGIRKNIEELEKTLIILHKRDPIIQLLESIPGIGTITALTFKSIIDNPFRFSDPRDVGAYLGLTPSQYSSGDTVSQGKFQNADVKN